MLATTPVASATDPTSGSRFCRLGGRREPDERHHPGRGQRQRAGRRDAPTGARSSSTGTRRRERHLAEGRHRAGRPATSATSARSWPRPARCSSAATPARRWATRCTRRSSTSPARSRASGATPGSRTSTAERRRVRAPTGRSAGFTHLYPAGRHPGRVGPTSSTTSTPSRPPVLTSCTERTAWTLLAATAPLPRQSHTSRPTSSTRSTAWPRKGATRSAVGAPSGPCPPSTTSSSSPRRPPGTRSRATGRPARHHCARHPGTRRSRSCSTSPSPSRG